MPTPTTLRDLTSKYPGQTYSKLSQTIRRDPTIHTGLKKAITDLEAEDPVDAFKDAILLAELMMMRAEQALGLTRLAYAGVSEPSLNHSI